MKIITKDGAERLEDRIRDELEGSSRWRIAALLERLVVLTGLTDDDLRDCDLLQPEEKTIRSPDTARGLLQECHIALYKSDGDDMLMARIRQYLEAE